LAQPLISAAAVSSATKSVLTYDTGSGDHLAGRLASVTDASGQRIFSYDANGYLAQEQRIVDGVTYVTDYDFDAAGNLRSMVYPTGLVVQYQPDAVDVGRVGSVQLDTGGGYTTLADNLAYAPFGPQNAMHLGNGIDEVKTFGRNYQIATLAAGNVLNLTYTPDNAGNIAAITDNLNSARSQSFAYDALDQLTGASGIYGSVGFAYDRSGNRLTRTLNGVAQTYTYMPGTNRLDSITGAETVNFSYDARGNTIGRAYIDGTPPADSGKPDYACEGLDQIR
jgi:YD repeat-containing protein